MLSRHPRSIWYTHYFPGLLIYRFDSPLIFSNAEIFSDELRDLVREADPPVRTVVINCEMIHDMGTTAAD
jgi:MFS superfamily sulfate permease-like transporter